MAKSFWYTGHVERITGISHRQLRHWVDTGLVPRGARRRSSTSRGYLRFDVEAIDRVALIACIRKAGVSIQQVRPVLDDIQRSEFRPWRPGGLQVLLATKSNGNSQESHRLLWWGRIIRVPGMELYGKIRLVQVKNVCDSLEGVLF